MCLERFMIGQLLIAVTWHLWEEQFYHIDTNWGSKLKIFCQPGRLLSDYDVDEKILQLGVVLIKKRSVIAFFDSNLTSTDGQYQKYDYAEYDHHLISII